MVQPAFAFCTGASTKAEGGAKMAAYVLKAENMIKHFRYVTALDGVTVCAQEGKITAIVGDNGSGKTTLIKIIAGLVRPDSGMISFGGQELPYLTPARALQMGIRTVYQDLALDDCKNSFENIFLGNELMKGPFLDRKKMEEKAAEVLGRLKVQIADLYEPVRNLSGGQRQGIAIARAVLTPGKLLLLDEPTAAMGIGESYRTMELFKRFRDEGMTQLIVSHNLQQVYDLADYIYVFRSGRCMLETETGDVPLKELEDLLMRREEELIS